MSDDWTQCRGCASPACTVRGQCAFPKDDSTDRVVEAGGDLIERLRDFRPWPDRSLVPDICNEAATALESSQSLLARRTKALEEIRDGYGVNHTSKWAKSRASEALSDLGNDGARRG